MGPIRVTTRGPSPGRGIRRPLATVSSPAGGPGLESRIRSRLKRGAQNRQDVLPTNRQRVGRQRVRVEQGGDERGVGKVREHRAVAGDDQLSGVVATQTTAVHLLLEPRGAPFEQRAESRAELVGDDRTVEGLAPSQADKLRSLLKEAKRGAEHLL